MYIRIVRAQPKPGQVDELARRWKEFIAPRLVGVPGFRHGYFSGDRDANRAAGVTIWDEKPGAAAEQAMQEFRQHVQDIVAGPPTIEDNEVLAEA